MLIITTWWLLRTGSRQLVSKHKRFLMTIVTPLRCPSITISRQATRQTHKISHNSRKTLLLITQEACDLWESRASHKSVLPLPALAPKVSTQQRLEYSQLYTCHLEVTPCLVHQAKRRLYPPRISRDAKYQPQLISPRSFRPLLTTCFFKANKIITRIQWKRRVRRPKCCCQTTLAIVAPRWWYPSSKVAPSKINSSWSGVHSPLNSNPVASSRIAYQTRKKAKIFSFKITEWSTQCR